METIQTNEATPPTFLRPDFDCIPAELKLLKNWVLWVPRSTGRKWTKRPIQTSGFYASTTKPEHWSSFDDVRRAYDRAIEERGITIPNEGRVPIGGIGFVFDNQQDENGLVFAGVDFDHVILDEGKLCPIAEERLSRLASYCELSVSGRGLHVIVKARPLTSGITHGGTELYTAGRYFTMTAHIHGEALSIVDAEHEFAALAAELRAAKRTSSGSGSANGASPPGNDDPTSGFKAAWFEKLADEKRSEVVRQAALHIAKSSNAFERTDNGGNYLQYVRLALAIARSRVPDAEEIFLEAASKAKDADSEEDLRRFFRNCEVAHPHINRVTIGTLLYSAQQCRADFSKWKLIADEECSSEDAVYVPSNAARCRELLDKAVAADPRTFTLGDRAGPLVILRVPDSRELPPTAQWQGDLPGATLATPADLMQRAERLTWKAPRKNGFARIHPPRAFVTDYLSQMRGQYGAPPLRGIARVPRIDDQGEIHFCSGYDRETGLFHDRTPTLDVPPKPSRGDAREAAKALLHPFSKYRFENCAAGDALVLAAVMTAIERPFLDVAPVFVVRSSMAGTGKGLIVRSLVRLAYDTLPTVITWGGGAEEFEKRLAALLLQSPGALSVDNANGMLIEGDLLESIITEGRTDIRPLGRSETVKVRCRSFIAITGNNPIITGDMARRTLVLDLVPRSADPERDQYDFNPAELIQRERMELLRAAYTIMRAYRLAGMPKGALPAVGSFEAWSRRVRDLVFWLTDQDVAEGFRRNKVEDPRRQGDGALLAALHQHFGSKTFKSAEVIALYWRVRERRRLQLSSPTSSSTAAEEMLYDALEDVLGGGGIGAQRLGTWARRVKGAHLGGYTLDTHHDRSTNANTITVRATSQGGTASRDPGSYGSCSAPTEAEGGNAVLH